MSDILANLNPAQLEAVTATEGYVRVIAGAGSGKTRALSGRFAFLVNEIGILPGSILCVTFTNKAANEMRSRIHALTGDNDTGYVNTFHGFCVTVLREDSHAVNYPKNFLVLDNADIDEMLRIIYEERGLTLRDMTFSDARDMIEMQKLVQKPDYYLALLADSPQILEEQYLAAKATNDIIFYGYLLQQKKCFGFDYNDLIKVTLAIFSENPDIREKWQQRLEYIMIDEFQDIDALQYELMQVLSGWHKNLFIVGDPDQTVYTWRGANVRFLLDFPNDFPGTRTIMMNENYRSTPEILAAANSLISANKTRVKKDLVAMRPAGEKPLVHHAANSTAEAQWMALQFRQLHESGVPYGDITVLYRAHYITRSIEEVLLKEQIPYTIYSGVQFYQRKEIRDAIAYLRLVVYRDDLSFLRVANVPKRNLGKTRMKAIRETAIRENCSLYDALVRCMDEPLFRNTKAKSLISLVEQWADIPASMSVSDLLSRLLDESGYEKMLRTEGNQERLDNLAELRQTVYDFEVTCGEELTAEAYLTQVALLSNTDLEMAGKDRVKLMTVHAAKGLEFPNVFLCGMNEGVFPSRKVLTLESMEEERRLAFVAVTRAEDRLFISECEGFNHNGTARYPSRFVLGIAPGCLRYTEEPPEGLLREAGAWIALQEKDMEIRENPNVFPAGTRVRHSLFGEGTVQSVDMERRAHMVLFDQLGTERSIGFRAKLERI